jgi:serine protease inhibitor
MDLISSDLPRTAEVPAAGTAAAAVSAFSAGLFSQLAQSSATNLICSPYSVALALGMTVQGAKGDTAKQILDVLHSDDAAALADGLNALDLTLAARSAPVPGPSGSKPERIELASANSLWGQRDLVWQKPFLDVLARDFGTGMRVVDYATSAEAARSAINTWVSRQTHTRIPQLVPSGALTADTQLTLVNALYFRAPWQTPFEPGRTVKAPFHRLDGSTVDAELMNAQSLGRFASGPGWVAVDLPYARGELAMAVVVPETGRFAEIEKSLTGARLTALLTGFRRAPVRVGLPRWTARTQSELQKALTELGMPLPFTDGADFSGMTAQESLMISAVLHEGFIAVDEAGTEAAAATAVIMRTSAGLAATPQSVVADRPFLYVIHDIPTGTPLFIGRVLDPTAG